MADDVLESSALHALLAHRFPFLLVDRILIVEPGRSVIGTKCVSAGEWWCDPQVPHAGAMPFSLVIEALAQTTGALLRDLNDGAGEGLAYFMGADKVRLRRRAYPGDEIALAVSLVQLRRGVCRTRDGHRLDGELVARALLTVVVRSTR